MPMFYFDPINRSIHTTSDMIELKHVDLPLYLRRYVQVQHPRPFNEHTYEGLNILDE